MLTTYSVLEMKWLWIYAKRLAVKSKCNRFGVFASSRVPIDCFRTMLRRFIRYPKLLISQLCRIWCVCVPRFFHFYDLRREVHTDCRKVTHSPIPAITISKRSPRINRYSQTRVRERRKKKSSCAWDIVMQHALTAVMHQIRSHAFISQWCL